MRGDQLARQWRIIRAIKASRSRLTVTEIVQREETGIRMIYRDLEALQAGGVTLYNEKIERSHRSAFIDTSKLKIPPLKSRKDAKITKRRIQASNAVTLKRLAFSAPGMRGFSWWKFPTPITNLQSNIRWRSDNEPFP